MNEFIIKDNKKLRMGYTTGTCATAAAKAAAFILISGEYLKYVDITTPKGISLKLELLDIRIDKDSVSCAIKKDSGDDPDITNGILIYAEVVRNNNDNINDNVNIDGGIGIGRITKPGLDQPIGSAAINSTPRRTIRDEVDKIRKEYNYHGGLDIIISTPQGVEIAKKTFNPKLGIVGGISILGTTGIVMPMSEDAIIETIKTEMRMHKALGDKHILITPGNYGEAFIKENYQIDQGKIIQCSNYIIDAVRYANELKFESILLIGHIGKLIKLAGGMVNTHSKYGDNRADTFIDISTKYGISNEGALKIKEAVSADEMIKIIDSEGIKNQVMKDVSLQILDVVNNKMNNKLEFDVIVFSNIYGVLSSNRDVKEIFKKFGE